ncbi:MAG: hypothetical protein GWO07_14620 [Candidatus Dadabacteria bacterium]|nr:hypothetical protein [Candidatus Dadabacteria bacterium]NIS09945.1 hypothetical protein [Candidatus Dadabacteria bacterium]NIV41861.1 hypothetical protein [Candidatus Dadabacteria bacterium]NIY22920.1 hypothetical protein [Candidatus Dadabacteria bacterium]
MAILPDVIRLDLDRAPADQSIGLFGLQNGRRPQDDVADIGLALLRQLADVKFPDAAMVPVGEDMIPVPGSGPLGERAALDCSNAEFPQCADRRVLVVLQGTDFTTPDGQIGVVDLTTSGNDREFESNSTSPFFENTVFPFMAVAHEPATGSSSGCSVIPATANTGAVALGSMLPFLTVFGALGLRALRRKLKV